MNTHPAAQALLADPRYRFTIREIGRGDLRKRMTASRFLAKRQQYIGRAGIRVDVLDTVTGATQCWDITLNKPFFA